MGDDRDQAARDAAEEATQKEVDSQGEAGAPTPGGASELATRSESDEAVSSDAGTEPDRLSADAAPEMHYQARQQHRGRCADGYGRGARAKSHFRR